MVSVKYLTQASSRKLNTIMNSNTSMSLRVEVLVTNLLSSLKRGDFPLQQEDRKPSSTRNRKRKQREQEEEEENEESEEERVPPASHSQPRNLIKREEYDVGGAEETSRPCQAPIILRIKLPQPTPEVQEAETLEDCQPTEETHEAQDVSESFSEFGTLSDPYPLEVDPFEALEAPEPLEGIEDQALPLLELELKKRKIDEVQPSLFEEEAGDQKLLEEVLVDSEFLPSKPILAPKKKFRFTFPDDPQSNRKQ